MRFSLKNIGYMATGIVIGVAFNITSVNASNVDVVIPENASTAWVSNNLNQSGLVMSVRTFYSPESVESVLDFYRAAWFKEGEVPGFIENNLIDWKLISQIHDKENVVLQLKPSGNGGSTGFLSIAQINGASQPVVHDFPLPDATEEYGTTYLKESGADVHTMTFITKQPVGVTTEFYKDRLARKGWAIARQDDMEGSRILLFNRRDDRLEMVVQNLTTEDTVIFVNRVKHDG